MTDQRTAVAGELRTPRAAALAGIVFALILATVLVLLRSALSRDDASDWIADPSNRRQLNIALELIPFAGIAFLWFIGVIRTHLGVHEDRLFATVFLGSGLLLVAMLFTAAGVAGGLLLLFGDTESVTDDDVVLASAISTVLVTLAIRMAAVFTLVVTNLGRRTRVFPGWLSIGGYLSGLVLLLAPSGTPWVDLLFPAWVFVLSVHILIASFSGGDSGLPAGA